MQEIKKRRIVIASVLKPVNDPRMLEKIGQSLSHYEVHIIGTKASHNIDERSIFLHPLSSYSRFGFNRVLAPARILKKILQLKPSIVIVCTHELLWMVLAARIFTSCKVIYDIRENYYRNILHTNAFPPIIRTLIALYVRLKEWITSPFINNFFLAEAGYSRELAFIGDKAVVLENKLKSARLSPAKKWSVDDNNFHLLFSGTLAPSTGVFIAIDLAIKLHEFDPKVHLHILGFSPMHTVRQQIMERVSRTDFIRFRESLEPIPHDDIMDAIQKADMGIISYPPNFSTENTIPTKLFEYLGYSLPILLIDHPPWVEICSHYQAAVTFDVHTPDIPKIYRAMMDTPFYAKKAVDVFWESEEKKLLQTISSLLRAQ